MSTPPLEFVDPPSDAKEWRSQFVVWPNLPIRVRVEGDAWQLVASDVYRSVQGWNKAIGCEVFTPSFQEDAEVVVSFTPQPEGENLAGTAQYVTRKNKKYGKYWGSDIHIHVLYFGSQPMRDNVMGHELGHALGLADLVDSPTELMNGEANTGMHVDDEVLAELKRLYCSDEVRKALTKLYRIE